MEDQNVKSLKSAARCASLASAAALTALALASCSAGQISQTANQVAPVDGMTAGDRVEGVSVYDVTVFVDEETNEASLKFVATNQDTTGTAHTIESITVDGVKVDLADNVAIEEGCTLLGDTARHLDLIKQADETSACINYTATEVDNQGWAYASDVPVTFTFDKHEPIELVTTVSAPTPEAGTFERDYGHSEHAGHAH
ncbi:hypothetical protein [Corynebacterium uterequi]|uniref:hypothetical protein n=1 Tax=Corynebacterium uterequi TaxID=1072256 RepID=UPI000640C67C|nr:hypothetical protein [Corynebacterium uterequi]